MGTIYGAHVFKFFWITIAAVLDDVFVALLVLLDLVGSGTGSCLPVRCL